MIVLDASVLVAHFSTADAHHAAATRLLTAHRREDFVASTIMLAEFLVGPTRVGRTDDARRGLEALTVRSVGVAEPDGAYRLAELRATTGLKLPDCCVLDAAQQHRDARVASFDARLLTATNRLGVPLIDPLPVTPS